MAMENHFAISTGGGGSGENAAIGGRGGDVAIQLNYNHYGPGSSDTALLMSLPRAVYAAHDSGREGAPSPCLPGTRVAILKEIVSWFESPNSERPPVYWLNGLAGIGKSTIAKTVAERAQEKAMLGASFFFSRSDKPLQDPRLVLPTLAFQLAKSDNAFKDVIVEALTQDPTIGHKELLPQLQDLILTPLLKVNSLRGPTLIILDALDECEERGATDILRLVFSHAIRIPFVRILITSRPHPHLSSVFSKVPNLAKTILHDIEASVVQRDIRFYVSTELARIPEKLDLPMPAEWVTEDQRDELVEKSGKLFVYASTAIRFIGDDRMRDPRRHLSLILNTGSAQQAGATPYSQLDDLYLGVLRNSLSTSNHPETLKRFQIVVGSIVLLHEPLPLYSLAQFVRYDRHVIEATLYHLHSVIIPPSDIHEAPRIYHPSFLEFIKDASRCSMAEFVIVPVPEQELRHATRCFELMATHLKRNVAGISDPSRLNREVDGFEEKVREALLPEVQYACRYWASHLSHVEFGEVRIVEALEVFSMRSILWWFEAMSLIGSISTAMSSIQEAQRWAISSKCKSVVVTILSDAYRFIFAHGTVIRGSAPHIYHSALPFTPHNTMLYKVYCDNGKDSIGVLQGVESEWPQNLSTLLGHSGAVTAIAFSPQGLRLASGSDESMIQLWDAVSGTHIVKLQGHSHSITTVAFSPDGLRLASGSIDRTLRLWDATSGAPIAVLKGHSDSVRAIAFSPDGLHLASASKDRTIQFWDAMLGLGIRTVKLEGNSGLGWTVAFSPDRSRLVSGSDDGALQLWDAISGAHIASLEGHSRSVITTAFSVDGLRLASGSFDCALRLWDAVSGMHYATLQGHSRSVRTVAFSPDGLHLVSGSDDRTLRLWDAISGAPISKLEGHSGWVRSVAFSPDGLHLASGSEDSTLRFWDTMLDAPTSKLEVHSEWVLVLAFSPDGLHLASGSADTTLRLWDAILGTLIAKLEGHSGWVRTVVFSPDGSCLASGSDDHTLWLWHAVSGVPIARMPGHSGLIRTIAFSSDSSCLASGSDDHTIWLWDVMSGVPIYKLEGHSGWVTAVAFSPHGLHLASGSDDRTLRLWDGMSGMLIAKLDGHSSWVSEVAFSADGRTLITHAGVEAFTWDLTLRPPLRLSGSSKVGPGPIMGSTPFICSLHGRWIVVGKRKGGPLRRLCYIPPHYFPSTPIIVSSQRTQPRVAVGCGDGRIIILTIPYDLIPI